MSGGVDSPATTDRHEAEYEWDSSYTAVQCRCGFYRIAEGRDVAEREYANHIDNQGNS